MDVKSPHHLERFRDQPELKAVLLREAQGAVASEARFERTAKNMLYWAPVERLAARFASLGSAEEICEEHELYGKPCWLLATLLVPRPGSPYAIAIAAADGAPVEDLVALMRSVSHDYWLGSYFFK